VSARQWKDELVRRTSLTEDEIGEYSGAVKEIRPVTIATYQVLTTKRKGVYPHLDLGVLRFDRIDLVVRLVASGVPELDVQALLSFSGEIGPVSYAVDDVSRDSDDLARIWQAGRICVRAYKRADRVRLRQEPFHKSLIDDDYFCGADSIRK